MPSLKVRACIKCKLYVPIHESNYKSIKIVDDFESDHRGHTLITANKKELGDGYKSDIDKYN